MKNGASVPTTTTASLTAPNNNNVNNNQDESSPQGLSRRDVLLDWPVLAVGSAVITGELLATTLSGLSLSRPAAHEQRVADTIRRTLVEAATTTSRPVLKVLEIGIGADCRLLRRGLYNPGIERLANTNTNSNIRELQIVGLDLVKPKDETVRDAQLLLDQLGQQTGIQSTLQIQQGSITSPLPLSDFATDGSFDAVICCLTLCSVSDPRAALEEMRRLIRPIGGTFGYVEHVAVNPDEPYRFLEWQQTTLDPLQQLVADNCHLHRYTQETIHQVFGTTDTNNNDKQPESSILQEDRFLVDKMWPVTSQCSGVIQRRA